MANTLFDSLLGAIQHEATSYSAALTEFVAPWMKHFLAHSVPKMKAMADEKIGCEQPHLVPGGTEPCRAAACLRCASCGKPTCLAHAFVNYRSEAVCCVCIGEGISAARRRMGAPDPRRRPEAEDAPPRRAPPPSPGDPERPRRPPPPGITAAFLEQVEAANVILGVKPNMAWEDIRNAYKRRLAKYHPDRFEQASRVEKRTANERYLAIRNAFDILEKFRDLTRASGAAA